MQPQYKKHLTAEVRIQVHIAKLWHSHANDIQQVILSQHVDASDLYASVHFHVPWTQLWRQNNAILHIKIIRKPVYCRLHPNAPRLLGELNQVSVTRRLISTAILTVLCE